MFNSLIGISWLWFFGSVFLTSFTPFARDTLHGDENVVTLLLAVGGSFDARAVGDRADARTPSTPNELVTRMNP